MSTSRLSKAIPLCVAAWLAGCTTPPAVRDLAEKTAANVGVLSAQVDLVAQESRQLAELRSANIGQLHAANARLRASYNYDVELTKKAGRDAHLRLIGTIEQWGETVAKIFEAAENAEAERRAAALATHTKLDTKSETLANIAASLAAIAREESAEDRVRFLIGFSQQLKKEVDAQLGQSSASATAAKKLIDDLKP